LLCPHHQTNGVLCPPPRYCRDVPVGAAVTSPGFHPTSGSRVSGRLLDLNQDLGEAFVGFSFVILLFSPSIFSLFFGRHTSSFVRFLCNGLLPKKTPKMNDLTAALLLCLVSDLHTLIEVLVWLHRFIFYQHFKKTPDTRAFHHYCCPPLLPVFKFILTGSDSSLAPLFVPVT